MKETGETGAAADIARYLKNYLVEMDGVTLYHALAAAEEDEKRAVIFEKMAGAEERHAQRWVRLIQSAGGTVPSYRRSARVRLLGFVARHFGTRKVLPIISALEARDEAGYLMQPEAEGLPAQERARSRALREMSDAISGQGEIIGREAWHRMSRVGSLRAAVFGVNDRLASNFSLVMGFAGATATPAEAAAWRTESGSIASSSRRRLLKSMNDIHATTAAVPEEKPAPSPPTLCTPAPGRKPARPRSLRLRQHHHLPNAPTTSAMPACPPGSTPASPPPRSPNGPATASPSSSEIQRLDSVRTLRQGSASIHSSPATRSCAVVFGGCPDLARGGHEELPGDGQPGHGMRLRTELRRS